MIVMSIAGVDPSGGAGVLTDIKAFQAIGVYGCGIVTALTAQNPYKFFSTMPVPEEFIEEQIDSVMDGGDLTREDIAKAFNKYLLPLSVLTTPNVSEAEKLADFKINTKEDAIEASKMIKCNNIITGGHLDGINTINIDGEISIVKQKLIETDNLHGTGCNLSAAITAFLAKNNDLHTSILKALDYVYEGIKNGNYGTLIAKI